MQGGTTGAASSAAGGDAPAGDKELLGLEHAVLNACETLSEVARVALDFTYDQQDVLFTKVCVPLPALCSRSVSLCFPRLLTRSFVAQ